MIYAWTQAFHTTPEYILHGISYENLILLSSAAPNYDIKDNSEEWDESIDANNPDNFNNNEEEEFI